MSILQQQIEKKVQVREGNNGNQYYELCQYTEINFKNTTDSIILSPLSAVQQIRRSFHSKSIFAQSSSNQLSNVRIQKNIRIYACICALCLSHRFIFYQYIFVYYKIIVWLQ